MSTRSRRWDSDVPERQMRLEQFFQYFYNAVVGIIIDGQPKEESDSERRQNQRAEQSAQRPHRQMTSEELQNDAFQLLDVPASQINLSPEIACEQNRNTLLYTFFLTQFLCQAICTQRTPKGPK